MTCKIKGIECEDEADAFGWLDARGHGRIISIGNKVLVVDEPEAHRIEALGVPFAYVLEREMPDGSYRTMTVPVND